MNEKERDVIYEKAKKWVLDAGIHIRKHMHEELNIETKSNPNDLVTSLDKETEHFFVRKIKAYFPDHLILGEEGYGDSVASLDGTVWIIDPIDGTMNFVHQRRNFAISVGVFHNGQGEIGLIYDVMADNLYHAKRGEGAYKNDSKLPPLKKTLPLKESIISLNHYWLCPNRLVDEKQMQQLVRQIRGARTIGSAAIEFAQVAEGVADGYLSLSLMPWDVAAGMILVHEVGGKVTNIDGEPLNLLTKESIVACNSVIYEEILDYLKKAKQ